MTHTTSVDNALEYCVRRRRSLYVKGVQRRGLEEQRFGGPNKWSSF